MELRRAVFIYTKGPETENLEETLQLGFPGKEGQKGMDIPSRIPANAEAGLWS